MEDSLKGILVTLTIVGLFITAILNFIVLFPQEQGITFSDPSDSSGYLVMNNTRSDGNVEQLELINNASQSGYDEWDVTTGFMGTNQIKQSQGGVLTLLTSTSSRVLILAKQVFGSDAGSPIIYTLIVLSTLGSGYLIYMFYKFVRTGK
jgi:hypothetical protein